MYSSSYILGKSLDHKNDTYQYQGKTYTYAEIQAMRKISFIGKIILKDGNTYYLIKKEGPSSTAKSKSFGEKTTTTSYSCISRIIFQIHTEFPINTFSKVGRLTSYEINLNHCDGLSEYKLPNSCPKALFVNSVKSYNRQHIGIGKILMQLAIQESVKFDGQIFLTSTIGSEFYNKNFGMIVEESGSRRMFLPKGCLNGTLKELSKQIKDLNNILSVLKEEF